MTIDLDAAIKTLEAHMPNDVICKKADLLGLIQRLREAENKAGDKNSWIAPIELTDELCLIAAQAPRPAERHSIMREAWKAIRTAVEQQRKIATGEDIGL